MRQFLPTAALLLAFPYLVRQLDAYADGRRHHDAMTGISKGLTPQQRAELGEYFSKLAIAASPARKTEAAVPARGRVLATRAATTTAFSRRARTAMNRRAGIGRDPNPYLAGLAATYIAEELQEWKAGRRDTDPSGSMAVIARNMSESDVKAVAAYYAAQEMPPQKKTPPAKQKPAVPTKPGVATKPPAGVGAGGGDQTTGGAQGPGGVVPAPSDRGKK